MNVIRCAVFIAALPLLAQQPKFEVASVKPSHPAADQQNHSSINNNLGSFRATNYSLHRLIAYALGVQSYQVSGGLGWVRDDHFDIVARNEGPDEPIPTVIDVSKQEARIARIRARLLDLLETRFGLVLRQEEKEMPIYALTVDKGGPKMKVALEPKGNVSTNSGPGGETMQGVGMSMPRLCTVLSSVLEKPVNDETGLAGYYDLELKYSLDAAAGKENTQDVTGPTIFTAIRETLGLRLSGKKGPVKVWVVEKAERPSEN